MKKSLTKRAVLLFIRNEKNYNNKSFKSRFIYELFNNQVEQLLTQTRNKVDFDTILCSDDPSLVKSNLFIKQTGKSFDEKFNNSIANALQYGYEELIIIGNDSPDITSEHLISTFKKISEEKIVIGPSCDGGIYLLGISENSFQERIKARWNTSNVKIDLLNFFSKNEIFLLDTLIDIDEQNDLLFWFQKGTALALLFQKEIATKTLVSQRNIFKSENSSTEQNLIRIQNQKAPPNLITLA